MDAPMVDQPVLKLRRKVTERTLPLLVPLKVMTPFLNEVGPQFSASDHRAPVDRQINTISSTCGLSQPWRIASSNSEIC